MTTKDPSTHLYQHQGEGSRSTYDDSTPVLGDATSRPELTRTISRISTNAPIVYKVYKRRFFGLGQLILLNIVVSWDWTAFAPISNTAAQYFNTTESAINWLSTAFFFAFVVASPFTFYTLNKHGPKTSIVIASVLLLIGNWVKYGGVRSNHFSVVMFGQVLIGFSQPFVLASPSTYSNLWFSPAGRTSATAITSLANPFGAALGQLISPFWATSPSEVPNSILYISIIATIACLPSFFIPPKPPTPPTPAAPSTASRTPPLRTQLRALSRSFEFYLLFIPFSVYVGFFNSTSSLLNQILQPYGFTEDDAGIAGAVLILVGLVSAAVSSPLIDKYKFYLWYIRLSVPFIALMYLVFIWAPPSRSIPFVYIVCAIEGAASFGLVPVVLEYLVEIHYPLGPETGSTLCWAGGQALGGVFVIVMDQLKSNSGGPPNNMHRALIFQAIVSMIVLPMPLLLGLFGRGEFVRRKRWEFEQREQGHVDIEHEEDEVRVLGSEGNGQLRI